MVQRQWEFTSGNKIENDMDINNQSLVELLLFPLFLSESFKNNFV